MLAVADEVHMPAMALRLGGLAINASGKPYDGALSTPAALAASEVVSKVDRALLYALMRYRIAFRPHGGQRQRCLRFTHATDARHSETDGLRPWQ